MTSSVLLVVMQLRSVKQVVKPLLLLVNDVPIRIFKLRDETSLLQLVAYAQL